ncbi:IucA/IucC family siderophore biosynthesis protein [Legionella geestiana]|uniref:IucA/IucC family protein n=1 Tax=Legionella geestiana TaxID=45065 RepID=UPI001092D3A4|nr:IucA/IucC family protein [Legionella geestiana]QDQ39582.1 IucA/IucC family siderophore biosynthesis protein [Legionella geestiana]
MIPALTPSASLSETLRFFLFEAGISVSDARMQRVLMQAEKNCVMRLQAAVLREGLANAAFPVSGMPRFLQHLQHNLQENGLKEALRWEKVCRELEQSIANDALASVYRAHLQERLLREASGYLSFWHWVQEALSSGERLAFLEQWGCIGHPTHPNFRVKSGFSFSETLSYSPEFEARVPLYWCALARHSVKSAAEDRRLDTLLRQHFPLEYQAFCERLSARHKNPEDYQALVVHPWQWRNRLRRACAPLILKGDAIAFPEHQWARPSMSFRTMMPESGGPHLKLSVGVHTTSATRTVSVASVHNGPEVSRWINGLLAQYGHFEGSLYLAAERGGMHLDSPDVDAALNRHCAMIVRENPETCVPETAVLVPLAALFATSPVSQKPLLLEVYTASGMHLTEFFAEWCRCVLRGQLTLLLRHGLAFEAHQQNVLVAIAQSRILALVLRDLGGIGIGDAAFFDNQDYPRLHADVTIGNRTLEALCATFTHGNLLSHLATCIEAFSAHSDMTQEALWGMVRDCLEKELAALAAVVPEARLQEARLRLLRHPWKQKCLLSMRLLHESGMNQYTSVKNPLVKPA